VQSFSLPIRRVFLWRRRLAGGFWLALAMRKTAGAMPALQNQSLMCEKRKYLEWGAREKIEEKSLVTFLRREVPLF
jgi:hypothetical protein